MRDSKISRKGAETQRGEEGVNGEGKDGVNGEEKAQDSRITNQQITNNAAKQLALERAVRLNPFEAQYHLQLGWAYARKWKEP
ncbi:MAG: hypothetical protein ABIL06_18570, partial [Pseudomonadota bacterium]